MSLNEDLLQTWFSVLVTLNDLNYVLIDSFIAVLTKKTLKSEIIEF